MQGERHPDTIKAELAEAERITLVHVPFWWDGGRDSLAATILQERPDLSVLQSPRHRRDAARVFAGG